MTPLNANQRTLPSPARRLQPLDGRPQRGALALFLAWALASGCAFEPTEAPPCAGDKCDHGGASAGQNAVFQLKSDEEAGELIESFGSSRASLQSFGLSASQRAAITEITYGRVNLEHIVLVEGTSEPSKHDSAEDLESIPGFSGRYTPDMDPPVVLADPELEGQWWIEKLRVPEAWDVATGEGVIIADCDAGYFHHLDDLHDNLFLDRAKDLANPDEPDVVDDGPFASHGTSVVAIMAGVHNERGTNGIAFDSKVIPLQNFNYSAADKIDKEEATARCVLEAISHDDVDIVVLENQTHGSSETYLGTREAVKLAMEMGVVVVSAAGNSGFFLSTEEQHDTGSIIVGALSRFGDQAGFSNFGSRVSISAFGEDLHTVSTASGAFAAFGGTSGATPQVAGAVALMLEVNSDLSPEEVKQILIDTRITHLSNEEVGGQLDVLAAVQAAAETVSEAPSPEVEEERGRLREILRGDKEAL